MADVKLNHIYKVYPNGTKAVNDFTMDIRDKEFIVFVGPSGCGKSTTLRMIAGLEEISAGELYIGENLVNDVEPKDRDIAMVFQNYALYPHMTVYENMAFGLKLRKLPKATIDEKVREAAKILDITDYLDKKPKEMSGGQRQRVALGRAIVREPKVFLLDEPLSNLDAKLRTAMRSQISALHQRLQTTFIYVTHDQVEAMTMGTRIVVMKDGFVQQIDTPNNIYRYPENVFVAGFIGSPQMNFYDGILSEDNSKIVAIFKDADVKVVLPDSFFAKADKKTIYSGREVIFGIRAEHISINPDEYACKAKIKVTYIEELGTECQVFGDFDLNSSSDMQSPTKVVLKAPTMTDIPVGSVIDVSLDVDNIKVFDKETEKNVIPRVPYETTVKLRVADGNLLFGDSRLSLPSALSLENGTYEITVPVSALSKGNDIKGIVEKSEYINGKYLLRVSFGKTFLFVLSDEDATGEIGLAVDAKRIKVTNETTGEILHSPVPYKNVLTGKLSRRKNREKRSFIDRIRKASVPKFSFDAEGQRFDCSRELVSKLVGVGGTKIIEKKLQFEFSPENTPVCDEGIECTVATIADYGGEKIAKCVTVGQSTLFVKVADDFCGKSLKIALPVENASIIDTERQIILK